MERSREFILIADGELGSQKKTTSRLATVGSHNHWSARMKSGSDATAVERPGASGGS